MPLIHMLAFTSPSCCQWVAVVECAHGATSAWRVAVLHVHWMFGVLLLAASEGWSRMRSSYGCRTFILRSRSADIKCCAAAKTMSFTGFCVTSIFNRCSIKICADGKITPGNRSASTSSPKMGHFIFPSTVVSTSIFLTPRSRLPIYIWPYINI